MISFPFFISFLFWSDILLFFFFCFETVDLRTTYYGVCLCRASEESNESDFGCFELATSVLVGVDDCGKSVGRPKRLERGFFGIVPQHYRQRLQQLGEEYAHLSPIQCFRQGQRVHEAIL
jgi:hypothetical protein